MNKVFILAILAASCLKSQLLAYTESQFFNATLYGNTELVKKCIKGGIDPNSKYRGNDTALMIASNYGHIDIVRYLLSIKVNMDETTKGANTSALIMAAGRGHLDVVRLLAEAGADITIKNQGDRTAAEQAYYWGHREVANYLTNFKRQKRN